MFLLGLREILPSIALRNFFFSSSLFLKTLHHNKARTVEFMIWYKSCKLFGACPTDLVDRDMYLMYSILNPCPAIIVGQIQISLQETKIISVIVLHQDWGTCLTQLVGHQNPMRQVDTLFISRRIVFCPTLIVRHVWLRFWTKKLYPEASSYSILYLENCYVSNNDCWICLIKHLNTKTFLWCR